MRTFLDIHPPAPYNPGSMSRPLPAMSAQRVFNLLWLIVPPLLLLALLLGAWLAPGALSEWVGSLSPGCVFRRLTGIACPGCGGTRALRALLEGDWWGAFRYNMLLLPSLMLLAVEYGRSLWNLLARKGQTSRLSPFYARVLRCYAFGVCAWFVLRNIFGL